MIKIRRIYSLVLEEEYELTGFDKIYLTSLLKSERWIK